MLQPCHGLRGSYIPRLSGQQGLAGILLGRASYRPSPHQWNIQQTRDERRQQSSTALDRIDEEVNPPTNTLPPPLDLPTRDPETSYARHLFQTGRAYGRFYWQGLKLTWSNHNDAKSLRLGYHNLHQWASSKHPDFSKIGNSPRDLIRLAMAAESVRGGRGTTPIEEGFSSSPVDFSKVTRSRFQTLTRDAEDWSNLPKFALLFLVCGEYVPLLVPFMPGLVPRTCRIPQQIEGMRKNREERKASSFKDGVEPLSRDLIEQCAATVQDRAAKRPAVAFVDEHTSTRTMLADAVSDKLTSRQLLHASTLLDLHSRWWARIGLSPPGMILRRRVKRRLQYLAIDDRLLLRKEGAVASLSEAEVRIACDERAMDVAGKSIAELEAGLEQWLKKVEAENVTSYFTALFEAKADSK